MRVPVVYAGHGPSGLPGIRSIVGVAALLLGMTAGQADAQRITVEPRVGVAVGGGAFGQYLKAGPSASLRLGFPMREGTSFFAEGGMDQFGSRELIESTVTGPDFDALRFIVGVDQELIAESLPASYDPWSLRVRLGAGAMRVKSETFRHVDTTIDREFSSLGPVAAIGTAVGYTVGGMATIFLDAGMNWAFLDEDDSQDLADLAPGYVDRFGSARTFPYSLGVRLPF